MRAWRTNARRALALTTAGCALCVACSDKHESQPTGASMGGTAPTAAEASTSAPSGDLRVQVTLDPSRPRPGELLTARVDPPESAGLRYEYEWFIDGAHSENRGPKLHVEGKTGKGSQIEVEVVGIAGDRRSMPARASARIGNLAPELRGIVIEPLGPVTAANDIVAVPKASDLDGDTIEYTYQWQVNGETVATTGNTLPAASFKRGDSIRLTVRASDGEDTSEIQSDPFQVENAAPKITSSPGRLDEQGRFLYRVVVEDPDGSSGLQYRLTEGPAGMKIDPVDGTVRWEPNEGQAGQHPVKVEVTDRDGAIGIQSFMMEVGVEGGAASPPAATN
jgi:hypothetical protein